MTSQPYNLEAAAPPKWSTETFKHFILSYAYSPLTSCLSACILVAFGSLYDHILQLLGQNATNMHAKLVNGDYAYLNIKFYPHFHTQHVISTVVLSRTEQKWSKRQTTAVKMVLTASHPERGDPSVIGFKRVNAPLLRLVQRDEPIVAPDNNNDGSWAG